MQYKSSILDYQKDIISYIDNKTIDTLPRSIILEGKKGSGKHDIVYYIAERFNLKLLDITENLSFEDINNYYMQSIPFLYIIDAESINVKDQNALLKFIEEPLKNSFIIIICNSSVQLIETIRNRCFTISMKPYDKTFLSLFIDSQNEERDILLDICDTPGQIEAFKVYSLKSYIDLAYKIFDKIGISSFPNMLTLCDKVGYNNEQDKLPADIFIGILKYTLTKGLKENKDYYFAIDLTENLCKNIFRPNISLKYLFENYLIALWKKAKEIS